MQHLIEDITTRKPLVIWSPFRSNDTLTRNEFLSLVGYTKYLTVMYDEDFIIAFQAKINYFGYESLERDLQQAKENRLNIYSAFLEDEIDRVKRNNKHGYINQEKISR